MPKHSLSIGVVVLAAAVVLPAQAQAEHENRYFGFGYQPYPYAYSPPPIYYPPPGVRQAAPGLYEYEVSPGRWVRVRPGHVYQQPLRERRDRRVRTRPQRQEALRAPEPPPVPKTKPEVTDEPEVAIGNIPATTSPAQVPATNSASAITCEAAADIVRSFGFSDVESTSCSGEIYGFDAARDGSAYSIKLSAADGELTEVRKR